MDIDNNDFLNKLPTVDKVYFRKVCQIYSMLKDSTDSNVINLNGLKNIIPTNMSNEDFNRCLDILLEKKVVNTFVENNEEYIHIN